jgi:peroxiredoxin
VLREDQEKANRAAFLLGPDGKITGVYPKISPETHSDAILKHVAFL